MTNLLSKVEHHAAALENCAAEMEAAGIGGDPNNGHAVVLRRMAADMRAQAVQGRLPSVHDPIPASGRPYWASASAPPVPSNLVIGALRACADEGVIVPRGNRYSSPAQLDSALDAAFKDKPKHLATPKRIEIKSRLYAAGLVSDEAPVDEKRVLHAVKLLKAAGIEFSTTHMFDLGDLNAKLNKTTLSASERIALKTHLVAAGMLAGSDGMVAPSPTNPNVRIAHSIFDNLGLERPAPGHKVSLGTLNAAMARVNMSTEKRIETKMNLAASGHLD
jgi:hypothetical protein